MPRCKARLFVWALVRCRDPRLQRRDAAFADVIAIPSRNFNSYIALHNGLATQTRAKRQPGRHIQPVQFVVFGFGEVFLAFDHNDVTRSAGAATATGMFQVNIEIQRHVQNRGGLSMIAVGKLPGLKFNRLVFRQERYFRHNFILRLPHYPSHHASQHCLRHTGE